MPRLELEEAEVEKNLDLQWGIKGGVGRKNNGFQFYKSFTHKGVEYFLYDSVILHRAGDTDTSIGKLVQIYETPTQEKKVKIVWYFRPIEIRNFLNDYEPEINELFLASGVGLGLYNINPLEAIIQKCNVLCASKDRRNPQASKEELRKADYIFYATFDVTQHRIEQSFPDEIAGVKVENFFNRKKNTTVVNNRNVKEDLRGCCSKFSSFSRMVNNLNVEEDLRDCTRRASSSSRLGLNELGGHAVKAINSPIALTQVVKELKRGVDNMGKQGYHPGDNTSSRHTTLSARSKILKSFQEKRSGAKGEPGEQKDHTVASPSNVRPRISEVIGKSSPSASSGLKKGAKVHPLMKETRNVLNVDNQWWLPSDKTTSGPKISNLKRTAGQSSGVREDQVKVENFPNRKKYEDHRNNFDLNVGERAQKSGSPRLGLYKSAASSAVKYITFGRKWSPEVKGKVSVHVDKLGSCFVSDDTTLRPTTSFHKGGTGPASRSQGESRDKVRYSGDMTHPSALVVPFKKRKLLEAEIANKVFDKFAHEKSTKTYSPNLEMRRSSWFNQLPWEERLERAHESGTLLSLENLDPSYTSSEVEVLVWHAFEEKVEAKMLQCSTFSSPHNGKALVIFNSKNAADLAISELSRRCLMLANGRPVVGSRATLREPGKPARLIGHLVIDKIKQKQSPEKKRAISSSHPAQPNTIEYDLAVPWCVLQEQSDVWWNRLYEVLDFNLPPCSQETSKRDTMLKEPAENES